MSFANKKKCYLQLVANNNLSSNVCIISCFQMPWVWSHAKWKNNWLQNTHLCVFVDHGEKHGIKVIVCMITSHNDSLWSWMLSLMKVFCS